MKPERTAQAPSSGGDNKNIVEAVCGELGEAYPYLFHRLYDFYAVKPEAPKGLYPEPYYSEDAEAIIIYKMKRHLAEKGWMYFQGQYVCYFATIIFPHHETIFKDIHSRPEWKAVALAFMEAVEIMRQDAQVKGEVKTTSKLSTFQADQLRKSGFLL